MHIIFPYTISLEWFKKLRFEHIKQFNPQMIVMSSPVWHMEMTVEQFKSVEIKRIKPIIQYEITIQNLHVKEKLKSLSNEDHLHFEYTVYFHNEMERNKYLQLMSERFGVIAWGKLDVKNLSDAQYMITQQLFRRYYDYDVSYHTNNVVSNFREEYEHLSHLSNEEKAYRKENPRYTHFRLHPTGEYVLFLHFEGELNEQNYQDYVQDNINKDFAEEVATILKAIRLKLMFK